MYAGLYRSLEQQAGAFDVDAAGLLLLLGCAEARVGHGGEMDYGFRALHESVQCSGIEQIAAKLCDGGQ